MKASRAISIPFTFLNLGVAVTRVGCGKRVPLQSVPACRWAVLLKQATASGGAGGHTHTQHEPTLLAGLSSPETLTAGASLPRQGLRSASLIYPGHSAVHV